MFPETLHITPTTLVVLAPRLAPYMPPRYNDKSWPAVIEAALFLSGEMGVNSTLWARACDVMSRAYAAVALALVSTRSADHFTSGPGGYFAGMLRKYEKNPQDLCLSRTLWALKNEVWCKDGHKQRRQNRTAARQRDADRTPCASRSAIGPTVPRAGTDEQYERRFCAGRQRAATTASSLAGAAAAEFDDAHNVQGLETVARVAQPRGGVDQSKFANPKKN